MPLSPNWESEQEFNVILGVGVGDASAILGIRAGDVRAALGLALPPLRV